MKKISATILSVMLYPSLASAQLVFEGSAGEVIKVESQSGSGLDAVYVADGLDGLRVSYTLPEGVRSVRWYRYSSLGGGYAEDAPSSNNGTSSRLVLVEGDMGYMIELPDGRKECFWLVDYSRHPFSVSSISESAERGCDRTALDIVGTGDEIAYYGINGRRFILDRQIKLSYRTLVADDDELTFKQTEEVVNLQALTPVVYAPAPLCATDFTVTGDRFLQAWGRAVSLSSTTAEPYAVKALSKATQQVRTADNEVGQDVTGGTLGGSAPCVVDFEGVVSDGAIFHEWQFSRFEDFEDINMRVPDLNFTYTFDDEGVTYVRLLCANSDGSCEYSGEVYSVAIGTSLLKCPNAFSPNGDGVNDEWKVAYSSIVSFECHIFDRYGRKMITFNDPSLGWDGKYKGKLVPSGAYFYVIKAKGADGKKYELSGDINIVNYK